MSTRYCRYTFSCFLVFAFANCTAPTCDASDGTGKNWSEPSSGSGENGRAMEDQSNPGSETVDLPPPPPPAGSPEGKIVNILQKMPDWECFSLNKEYPQERAEIEKAVAAISAYDLDTIRAALDYYARRGWAGQSTSWTGASGKELILIKYLFNLPRTVRVDSPYSQPFGEGWWNLPISDGEQFIRWPWSVDESGKWHLTGRFTGYKGGRYRALDAFDYYRKEFGKRDTRKEQQLLGVSTPDGSQRTDPGTEAKK